MPVVLGMPLSQKMIGTAFVVSYLLIAKMFNDPRMLVFAGIAGAVQFLLINRKDYREGPVFVVYLLSLGVVLLRLTG